MLALSVFLLACMHVVIAQNEKIPECMFGKNVIVHLNGWKYSEIQKECEAAETRFYCAIQIPPPIEHQQLNMTFPPGARNPWWQRYNTVSYKTDNTDSGTLRELEVMIDVCNANNVRIYVDYEINNMGDRTVGYGSAGSYYQGVTGSISYPGVPYNEIDFHAADSDCPTSSGNIEDVTDVAQIRYCARRSTPRRSDTGFLNDLRTSSEKVRNNMINSMNALIQLGVAGFRFAHARYVEPADVLYIVNGLDNLVYPGVPLDTRPFIYQDVFPDDIVFTGEYNGCCRVEEVNAGLLLADIIRKESPLYVMANLSNWGPDMGLMNSEDAVVFLDDPALQRGWLANWDEDGNMDLDQVLSFRDIKLYEMGNAFMLAHSYGYPRIHSSYYWDRVVADGQDINEYEGPPRYPNDTVQDVMISADGHSCLNDWNCEHRKKPILGMVSFSNLANGQDSIVVTNFWSNGYNQIAFTRATTDGTNLGFIAINNENTDLDAWIYSGLPQGFYCDMVTSDQITSPCSTGRTVEVDSNGRVHVEILANDPTGVISIFAQP